MSRHGSPEHAAGLATGLRPPYDGLDDAALAEHLLTRTDVALPPPSAPAAEVLADAARLREGRWLLVGEEHHLDPDDPDALWRRNPSGDKEWQIAQHKHYWAPALLHARLAGADPEALRRWERLTRSWLDTVGTGSIVESDAQVEALRLRSWVDAYLLLRRVAAGGGERPDPALLRRWLERIGAEAAYVLGHLKPVRNHRTFQLASVFTVGVCFPELAASPQLVARSRDLLTANLLADLLPDGVHVEMATHYHQLVAETAVAFVDLARRNGVPLEPALLDRVHAALHWSLWLTWPDGRIPLLGDSDDGDHAALLRTGADLFDDPELLWGATRGRAGTPPARPGREWPDAGYVVLRDGWGTDPGSYATRTHVLHDAARLGEGAHSHYDLLSFTLHCEGRPAVVDPGRFTYSATPDADGVDWRHAFKSTAAHNTVQVDGRDSTRYVARNKHGPEVRVEGRRVLLGGRGDWVVASAHSAEHTPVHTRLLVFVLREYLLVVDRVASDDGRPHLAEARLHLPEDGAPVLGVDGGEVRLDGAPAQVLGWVPSEGEASLDPGWLSRSYGVKAPAPVLRLAARGAGDLLLATAVGPRRTAAGPLVLERLTATTGADGRPAAFTVEGTSGGGRFRDVVGVPDTGGVPGVQARFAVVRTGPDGAVRWLTGQDVSRVELPGVPALPGLPRDVEWEPV